MTRYIAVFILIVSAVFAGSAYSSDDDTLYQVSTYEALVEGRLDGLESYGEISKHGDFGIGTFPGLDGEMVALDGEFYQVKFDGSVVSVDDSQSAPFATVTYFQPDTVAAVKDVSGLKELNEQLNSMIPRKDVFYAVRIDGVFDHLTARSVAAAKKPYPPLAEIIKGQSIFDFTDVNGTMVGFWCPAYVGGVNVPGLHLHFISEDRKSGGHVLDCRFKGAQVSLDETELFFMSLQKDDRDEMAI